MSIEQALIDNLETNLDAQYASLDLPSTDITAGALTWDGTTTVTAPTGHGVVVNQFLQLNSDAQWFKVLVASATSLTIENTYSVTIPSSTGTSSTADVAPPPPLSGTGNLDTFAEAIAGAFNTEPLETASFIVAEVPDATTRAGNQIFVSDEAGGAVPAFSDGTNWRRVTDRAIIS